MSPGNTSDNTGTRLHDAQRDPLSGAISKLARSVGGWWGGPTSADAAAGWTGDEDAHFRSLYDRPSAAGRDYQRYRPAFRFGHLAGQNPDYADRKFDDVERDLQSGWGGELTAQCGDWNDVREFARSGFERGREVRLTLSEEQLVVGKRQLEAGTVHVRKTVETERVAKTVPVTHEEVEIERRPVSSDAAVSASAQIGEERVVVPLMEEDVVVEKRPVVKEEIVVRKTAVTEQQTVEADLRKERVDVDTRGGVERGGEGPRRAR